MTKPFSRNRSKILLSLLREIDNSFDDQRHDIVQDSIEYFYKVASESIPSYVSITLEFLEIDRTYYQDTGFSHYMDKILVYLLYDSLSKYHPEVGLDLKGFYSSRSLLGFSKKYMSAYDVMKALSIESNPNRHAMGYLKHSLDTMGEDELALRSVGLV